MPIVVLGGETVPEKRGVLISALESAGFDLHLAPSDESFSVEAWRKDSVFLFIHTHGGNLVSSEAFSPEFNFAGMLAGNRQINVLFNKVILSDQFDKAPTIDLVQWRGGVENAHFGKLVTTLRTIQSEVSQQEKKLNSPPGWIIALWERHKVGALILAVSSFVFLAFIQNAINAETACSIDFAQPNISDACGHFGLGDKPTKTERLAWEKVDLANCDALQAHARQFPDGAFRARAIDLFEAGRIEVQTHWEPTTRKSPLFEPEAAVGSETESASRAALLARVDTQATEQCTGYTAGNTHKLVSATAIEKSVTCSQSGGKYYCEFDGYAVCELEQRVQEETRICGIPEQQSR